MGREAVTTVKNVNIVVSSSNLNTGILLFTALGQNTGLQIRRMNPAEAIVTVDDWMLVNRPAFMYRASLTLSGISPSLTAINQLEQLLQNESWRQDVKAQLWVNNPDTLTFTRFTGVAFLNPDKPIGDIQASGIGEVVIEFACHRYYNSGISKYADIVAAVTGAGGVI